VAAALAGTTCLAPEAGAVVLPCSTANLNGAYSVRLSGFIGRLPLSGAGILVFDGNGNITQASKLTFSKGFHVFQNVTSSGTYGVSQDCTGFINLNSLGLQQHYNIAVDTAGFNGVQTDFNTSVTLTATP
jgi:hypothetical protein